MAAADSAACLYEQHFGLADLSQTEALEILWPSGLRQCIERPPINKTIRIVEGRAGWEEVYKNKPLRLTAGNQS